MMHVTFPEIARVLAGAGSAVPAAESHGCLCGALCTSADYTLDRWLEEIVPATPAVAEADTGTLQLLFADTLRALRGEEMEFEPLLPDDDSVLAERTAAISEWCHGFLYGFGTSRRGAAELPPDVDEILRDFAEIGRAGVDSGEAGEGEEEAYAEVVEYVRVGVQLIHDELADARDAAGQATGGD
jgi:uncharacterized protein